MNTPLSPWFKVKTPSLLGWTKKMQKFLNYSKNDGLTITTYRAPNAVVGDLGDVVAALENIGPTTSCALDIDDAIITLEKEPNLVAYNVTYHAIETVHTFISDYSKKEDSV